MVDEKASKLAEIADEFMEAAGVPFGEGELGDKISDAMTDDEGEIVSEIFVGSLTSAIGGDFNSLDMQTIKLAEIFAVVAVRISLEQEAAVSIPLSKTDGNTVADFEEAEAPALAKLVKIARSNEPS